MTDPRLDGSYPAPRRRNAMPPSSCNRPVQPPTRSRKLASGLADKRRHPEARLSDGPAPLLVAPGDERAHVASPGPRRPTSARLRERGVLFVGPGQPGALAEGEQGMGRMAEPAEITAAIEALLRNRRPGPLAGRRRGS